MNLILSSFNAVVMLEIALELAANDPSYEDIARYCAPLALISQLSSKFFEHFVQISAAINSFGGKGDVNCPIFISLEFRSLG